MDVRMYPRVHTYADIDMCESIRVLAALSATRVDAPFHMCH